MIQFTVYNMIVTVEFNYKLNKKSVNMYKQINQQILIIIK